MTKTKVVHSPHRLAKTGRCLFGYSADTDLGILHVSPAGTFGTKRHVFSAHKGG